MAPLPATNTPRFKVNYISNARDHSFQLRSHSSPSAIGTLIDAFLTALSGRLRSFTIVSVEYAASGSDIFLPVSTGIEGNAYGSGTGAVVEIPWFYGFQGRSAGGKKWHLDIFGADQMFTDYICKPFESTIMDNAVAALQAFGSALVGIDDEVVTVYGYVNCGVNAHFQRAIRA